jgi:hypothetical protein
MIEPTITAMLIIIAIIHLAPIVGVLGVERLQSLYGEAIASNNMEILMRHRAVLFGILGVFFAYAAFNPALQPLAFLVAFATLAPFFYLAFSVGGYNQAIQKIVRGDVVASVALIIAVGLFYS